MRGTYAFGQVVTRGCSGKLRYPYMLISLMSPYSAESRTIEAMAQDYDALVAGRSVDFNFFHTDDPRLWIGETINAIDETALASRFRHQLREKGYHPETW